MKTSDGVLWIVRLPPDYRQGRDQPTKLPIGGRVHLPATAERAVVRHDPVK